MKSLIDTLKLGRLFLLGGAVSLAVVSCNTEEDDNDPPTDPNSGTVTPEFTGGDGALIAIKTITFQETPIGTQTIPLGLGVAVFFDNGNSSSFVNAGTVTLEGEELAPQTNNSYVYTPSLTSPQGIDLPSRPTWDVGGAGGVTSFSRQTSIGFPTVGMINSSTTVTAGSDITVTAADVSGADSVIFTCGGLTHTVVGNATSYTFPASETASLSAGPSVVQVVPYRIEQASVGGGVYWFVNESVATQSVTIE